jgi:hypothetical protein
MKENNISLPTSEDDSAAISILTDGPIKYYSFYRSALEAFNTKTNEYYIVFYPRDNYCSVNDIIKYKTYLIIGTDCEGYAIINTKTFYLKRYYSDGMGITNIDVKKGKILINENIEIPLPEF